MANYNVDIGVSVTGQNGLKTLETKLKKITQEVKDAEKAFVDFNQRLKSFDQKRQDRKKLELDLLKSSRSRLLAEKKFNEESQAGNKIARQKTAEFLKQQRILKAGGNQFPGGVGPQQAPLQGPRQAPGFQGVAAKRVEAQVRRNAQASIEAAKRVSQIELALDRKLEMAGLEREMNIFKNKEKLAVQSFQNQKRRNKQQVADFDKRLKKATTAGSGGGAAKGGNKGAQNLALGIGFPLLFGGGVGSVAGGALGSVGGMGGQVLGSAIGGIIDQTVSNIAKLGQALNPLTADIGAVTAAAGESGTAFEQLTKDLEKAIGKEKALAVATAQLATVIGQDGVKALEEFGADATDLGNATSEALSQTAAAVADLINVAGILKGLTAGIERGNLLGVSQTSSDPEIKKLREQLSRTSPGGSKEGTTDARKAIEDRIVARQKELQVEEQVGIAKQAQAGIQAKINEKTSSSISLKEQELVITQNGGDVLNEQVQTALQNIDAEKVRLKILEAQGDELKLNLAYLEGQLLFAIRTAKIEAAAEARRAKEQREADAAARKAAREQEAREREAKRLQESIFNEDLKQLQIQSKINQFNQSDLEAIETQKQELEIVLNARIDQVKLSGEDLILQKEKIDTLMLEGSLRLAGLDQLKEEIQLTKQLDELSAGAGFDVSAPFERNMKFAGGKSVLDTGPASFEEGAALAPLIEQEVQLDRILKKYPMIGEAATAAAGVVTLGVNEMINGTKSAEEVFSDFLKSIADMLLKTAQQMIAQYIAIGIAKAFAGLSGGSSSPGISEFGGNFGAFSPGASFNVPAGFAEGGYVTGPTNAVVGEGGEPEYIIPESKMRESMGRYSRGSRGSSVIPAEGGGAAGAEGGAATAAPIDVRYTVERINSVDYVTADQFQTGMKRAAAEGAQRGQQLTLSRLQQSPSTRRRIGM